MSTIYGYVRVSTAQQKDKRQYDNIKTVYPEAVIITDKYTGTKMDRPEVLLRGIFLYHNEESSNI